MSNSVHAVVLAAGKSSRFGTGQSKQLVELCGLPMLVHSTELLESLSIPTTVVLGHQADEIEKALACYGHAESVIAHSPSSSARGRSMRKPENAPRQNSRGNAISISYQKQQKGTGDAVRCAQSTLTGDHVLIINGDMPLLTQEVISSLIYRHTTGNYALTFCTTTLENPTGYGRVFADKTGTLLIREEKECTDAQRAITTVNAGVYIVQRDFLAASLQTLTASSTTGELYITDIIADAGQQGKKVGTYHVAADLVRGVNTLEELAQAELILYERTRKRLMQHGVRFIDPSSILIEKGVRVGRGSVIERGVHLKRGTLLHKNVRIGAYSIVSASTLHDGAIVEPHSVIQDSVLREHAQVGPFARLRGHADIGSQAVIGNFVEVKGSQLGAQAKAKHLSYLGDATVGERANIGAGAITCNYDGQTKHHTNIGSQAMIGANTSMVAPVSIGMGAYVAAGSTITRDVPRGALGIGRARQVVKDDWTKTRRTIGLLQKGPATAEHEAS